MRVEGPRPSRPDEYIDFAIYRLAVVGHHLRRSGYPLTSEQESRLRELGEHIYDLAGELLEAVGRTEFK